MASRKTPLTVVPDEPDSGPRFATMSEVEEFAVELPEEFLQCREMGHRWLPFQATENPDSSFERVLRCPRCKTRKEQQISSRGVILSTQYKHPEGYLHAGLGRIAGDGRGLLRLESIRRSIAKTPKSKK